MSLTDRLSRPLHRGAAHAQPIPHGSSEHQPPFSAQTVVAGNCGSALLSLVKVVAMPAYGHVKSVTPDASFLVPVRCGAGRIGMPPAFVTSEARYVVH